MSETSSPAFHDNEATPSPSTVGNTFMRQYYHFLAKEPQSLHRFYKAESRWCHGLGSHMEEPIAGQQAINDEILKRGYAGARVDLDIGSIDCQESLGGGVLVLVTGVMTLRSSPKPKPFVQTFFLAVQPKGYFVLNDCLRFLELVGTSGEEKDKEKKTLTENGQMLQTLTVEKEENDMAGVLSPKKTIKTTSLTTTKKVVKEKTPLSPVKATSTSTSSPVKPMTTTVTTMMEENHVVDVVKTPSPADSPIKTQDSSPVVPEAAPCVSIPAPADPVVSAPAEPEKPKTWAALFSVSKAATVTPSAAAPPAPASAKPSADAPVSAPAAISPTSGGPQSEKSPKTKSGTGKDKDKEKEYKRLYSLFIRELPPQTRENDLRELFKGYGSIAGVNVVPQRNFAFVDFYEQESMRAALAETKEFKVQDKVLQVTERGDRKDTQRSGFRGNDSRGRGRGFVPMSGRGDRKERTGDDIPTSSKGDRREGTRREKPGSRRGGKVDGTSHNRPEEAK